MSSGNLKLFFMPRDRRKSKETHTIRLYEDVENSLQEWVKNNYPLRLGQILDVVIDEGIKAVDKLGLFKKKPMSSPSFPKRTASK